MNPAAEVFYQKAFKYAKWSYIGILIPVAGVILALISHSMLKELTPRTDEDKYRLNQAKRIGHWGGIISLWPAWLIIFAFIFGILSAMVQAP